MEIAFQTKGLRRICERELLINREFGDIAGRKLQSRISELLAADCVGDLPIKGEKDGKCYRISFAEGKSILLEANHVDNPTDSKGHIDWCKVKRVKVTSIGGNSYDNQ